MVTLIKISYEPLDAFSLGLTSTINSIDCSGFKPEISDGSTTISQPDMILPFVSTTIAVTEASRTVFPSFLKLTTCVLDVPTSIPMKSFTDSGLILIFPKSDSNTCTSNCRLSEIDLPLLSAFTVTVSTKEFIEVSSFGGGTRPIETVDSSRGFKVFTGFEKPIIHPSGGIEYDQSSVKTELPVLVMVKSL